MCVSAEVYFLKIKNIDTDAEDNMKIPKFFKRDENVEDFEDLYNGDYYDDSSADADDADDTIVADDFRKPSREPGMSFGNDGGAPVSLKVVKPKSYDDGPAIADYLSAGSTVVLNIEELSRENAIRLIDFLLGATHVVGGEMKNVTKTTLVLAPRNVGVSEFDANEDEEDYEN